MPKPKGFTKEQLAMRAARLQKRWMKRYRQDYKEYQRAYYRGIHKQWWVNACRKAGVEI